MSTVLMDFATRDFVYELVSRDETDAGRLEAEEDVNFANDSPSCRSYLYKNKTMIRNCVHLNNQLNSCLNVEEN